MCEYKPEEMSSWVRMGMRKAVGPMLAGFFSQNENMVVITADVASSANLTELSTISKERFIDVGIAEQNMIAIAAGMALKGFNVFAVTYASFLSMRAYEAIRSLIGNMHLNVKLIALGSGFSLGNQGMTHFCPEDISLMHTIPGMCILSPADCADEWNCLSYLSQYEGPAFLRLTGIDGSPLIHKTEYLFDLSLPEKVKDGERILILGTGSLVNNCIKAARLLKKDGYSPAVYSLVGLKPIKDEMVIKIASNYQYIFTVEEHYRYGGLGDIIACALEEDNKLHNLTRIGIDDHLIKAMTYDELMDECGLSAFKIRDKIIETLTGKENS